ncbi:unnamed protein product, partial [Amoebophrya sp. A120]|eukprot:GSA120T00024217001.1
METSGIRRLRRGRRNLLLSDNSAKGQTLYEYQLPCGNFTNDSSRTRSAQERASGASTGAVIQPIPPLMKGRSLVRRGVRDKAIEFNEDRFKKDGDVTTCFSYDVPLVDKPDLWNYFQESPEQWLYLQMLVAFPHWTAPNSTSKQAGKILSNEQATTKHDKEMLNDGNKSVKTASKRSKKQNPVETLKPRAIPITPELLEREFFAETPPAAEILEKKRRFYDAITNSHMRAPETCSADEQLP